MGPVGPSLSVLRLVDLNVGDDQFLDLEILDLSVGLQVLEEPKDHLARLLGPPACDGLGRGWWWLYLCQCLLSC